MRGGLTNLSQKDRVSHVLPAQPLQGDVIIRRNFTALMMVVVVVMMMMMMLLRMTTTMMMRIRIRIMLRRIGFHNRGSQCP